MVYFFATPEVWSNFNGNFMWGTISYDAINREMLSNFTMALVWQNLSPPYCINKHTFWESLPLWYCHNPWTIFLIDGNHKYYPIKILDHSYQHFPTDIQVFLPFLWLLGHSPWDQSAHSSVQGGMSPWIPPSPKLYRNPAHTCVPVKSI